MIKPAQSSLGPGRVADHRQGLFLACPGQHLPPPYRGTEQTQIHGPLPEKVTHLIVGHLQQYVDQHPLDAGLRPLTGLDRVDQVGESCRCHRLIGDPPLQAMFHLINTPQAFRLLQQKGLQNGEQALLVEASSVAERSFEDLPAGGRQ